MCATMSTKSSKIEELQVLILSYTFIVFASAREEGHSPVSKVQITQIDVGAKEKGRREMCNHIVPMSLSATVRA